MCLIVPCLPMQDVRGDLCTAAKNTTTAATSGSGDVDDLAKRLQGQGLGKDRPAANYSLLLREPYLIRVYLEDGVRYINVILYVGAGTLTSDKGAINATLTKDGRPSLSSEECTCPGLPTSACGRVWVRSMMETAVVCLPSATSGTKSSWQLKAPLKISFIPTAL